VRDAVQNVAEIHGRHRGSEGLNRGGEALLLRADQKCERHQTLFLAFQIMESCSSIYYFPDTPSQHQELVEINAT
jgi:hypothetical protein